MKKTLYILRHAKAETGLAHQDDHSRKLVERGVEAAQIMGAYMFRQGIRPDKVLCSDAVRTHQTWSNIEGIYPTPLNVEFSRKIYLASANEMLGALAKLPNPLSSVLVIGHNPGVHQICLKLAKEGDEDLLDAMHLKFPTCALAVIELGDITWSDIMDVSGRLVDYVTPKMLAGIIDE
jgi:phosphohistidine phosphatase